MHGLSVNAVIRCSKERGLFAVILLRVAWMAVRMRMHEHEAALLLVGPLHCAPERGGTDLHVRRRCFEHMFGFEGDDFAHEQTRLFFGTALATQQVGGVLNAGTSSKYAAQLLKVILHECDGVAHQTPFFSSWRIDAMKLRTSSALVATPC